MVSTTNSKLFITQTTFLEIKEIGGAVGPAGNDGEKGPQGPQGPTGLLVLLVMMEIVLYGKQLSIKWLAVALGTFKLLVSNNPTTTYNAGPNMTISIHEQNFASFNYSNWITYIEENDILTIRNYDDFQDVGYYKVNSTPTLQVNYYLIDLIFIASGSQNSYTPGDRYMIGYVKSGPTGVQGNKGEQGDAGPDGEQGDKGPQGDPGPDGEQGDRDLKETRSRWRTGR